MITIDLIFKKITFFF
jgi:hypothetical protein